MPRRSSRPVVLGEFEENREYLLKLCDDAQEHILSLSYRDYMNNTPVKYMAAKVVDCIGEVLVPRNGHADDRLSEEFSRARNVSVHEYVRVLMYNPESTEEADIIWEQIQRVPVLHEQVKRNIRDPARRPPRSQSTRDRGGIGHG